MHHVAPRRLGYWLIVLALGLALAACSRRPPPPVMEVTPIKATDPARLHARLLAEPPSLAPFRLRGPFAVHERRDVRVRIAPGVDLDADLFLCAAGGRLPLVVLLHGHENSKEDHAFQGMHLASWGVHALVLNLPNQGPWVAHGRTIARLVRAIRADPALVDVRIDPARLVVAGHSFGGMAAAVAVSEDQAAVGAVLLDAAGIGRQLPALLKRVRTPVLLLGADEDISPTRNREYFFRFLPGPVAEVSIRDAVHEDAQFPSTDTARAFHDEPGTSEKAQISFVSALTASVLSLVGTGGIDHAFASFEQAATEGVLFNLRRK